MKNNNIHTLNLKEIASWWIDGIPAFESNKNNIKCSIPSLQRGAVWKVDQVELLWDSLMRGFPIGSLVVSEKIDNQGGKAGKYGDTTDIEKATHHLLDGQQRANAISLGFIDPFKTKNEKFSYLWIDLAYDSTTHSSTRKFLFRVVTPSHPWGYRRDDKASKLETSKIRKFMESKDKKPKTYDGYPCDANCPVPFVWLFEVYKEGINDNEFWESIDKKVSDNNLTLTCDKKHQEDIFRNFKQLMQIKIPLLEVPISSFEDDGISSIEHLFQRLNQQGTKLDGLELSYSMIKAYWSGIEDSFEQIEIKPMAEAYLAMLGMRLATMDANKDEFPNEKTIQQIRSLAREDKQKDNQNAIENYFGINNIDEDFDFQKDIEWVDKLLLHSKDNEFGLPPVLRTHIAHKSRDVYLLLLWMAKEFREGKKESLNNDIKKRIIGLVTALDWFGDDKKRAVNKIYSLLKDNPFDRNKYNNILDDVKNIEGKRCIKNLLSPAELSDKLVIDKKDIEKWSFWWKLVAQYDTKEQEEKQINFFDPINTIKSSRNLLIYAQREYVMKKFEGYDSLVDIWSEQNRPWDYDHILPSATLYRRRNIKFRKVGNEFLNCIGNLQVLAFEDNRSKNAKEQDCENNENLKLALIDNTEECNNFVRKTDDFNDFDRTKGFVEASKNRMIRIYAEWWDTLEIEKLINQT